MMLLSTDPGSASSCHCEITSGSEHGVTVRLIGELDRSNAPWLHDLLSAVALAGWTHVELDMRDVSFVDGGGLAVMQFHALVPSPSPHCLRVVHPSAPTERLLDVSGSTWLLGACGCGERVDP